MLRQSIINSCTDFVVEYFGRFSSFQSPGTSKTRMPNAGIKRKWREEHAGRDLSS
jgi:hypothetical protein